LGAQTDVNVGDARWLSPWALWSGILAGPIAWALDLGIGYALVKWVCATRHEDVLHGITVAALALVLVGAVLSWMALQRTAGDGPTDGGEPRQRARFMAILGLASSALFALQILARVIPQGFIDACR
jgi:hypothetical protein